MSTLNLNDYSPEAQSVTQPIGAQLTYAVKVRNLGVIAVALSVVGIFVPLIPSIFSFLLAKHAMTISRVHLVPIEYEKPAYWAYRVALTGMILWVVILIRIAI